MSKRSAFVDGGSVTKKPRGADGNRFAIGPLVPGIVIGKGGSKVKTIREETNVNVSIGDRVPPSQDRIMVIRGEPADTGKAMLMITQLILDANKTAPADKQASPEVRVLLHTMQAGSIIGKAGATIKQFMADSGAQIRVSTEPLQGSTEKACIINGDPSQIQAAVEMVLNKLMENPTRDGTESVPYLSGLAASPSGQVPPHMSQSLAAAAAYYGYQQQQPPQQNMFNPYMTPTMTSASSNPDAQVMQQFELLVPTESGGAIIGKGGHAVKSIKQLSECNVSVGEADPNSSTRTVTVKGATSQIPMALNMIRELAEPPGTQPQTEIISIPTTCSGAVIGKQGRAINEMKALSSCNISLAEPSAEAPEMRTVNITGTNIAVQIAAFLVRQKCEQHMSMANGQSSEMHD